MPFSWSKSVSIVKAGGLPKLNCKVSAAPPEPQHASVETDKLILLFICNCKGLRIAKTILKRRKLEDVTFQFQNSVQATALRTVCHGHRPR